MVNHDGCYRNRAKALTLKARLTHRISDTHIPVAESIPPIHLKQSLSKRMAAKAKPKTIDEYIDTAPDQAQQRLLEMLECLREAAPDADEALKWGNPALSYQTILFIFAAYKKHISLYPTAPVIRAFNRELAAYKTSSATVQFPLDEPLPVGIIRKLADHRVRAVLEDGATWM